MNKLPTFLFTLLITVISALPEAAAQCDKPVIIADAANVCPGGQTTLHTKAITGATYQWSDGGPSAASRPAGPGKYAVTVIHGACSETSDTVVIAESTMPAVIPGKTPAICAGESLTLYADTGNYWTRKPDMPANSRVKAVSFTIGSKGYMGTGMVVAGNSFMADWWEYDEATGVWTQKADFPGGPRAEAVGFALNNKGYIGTGQNAGTGHADFYEYDPFTNMWSPRASYAGGPVYGAVSFTAGGKGYIGLGNTPIIANEQKFWSYDPATNAWLPAADFPGVARRYGAAFSLAGKGYVTCGLAFTTGVQNDCWEYDPAVNAWSTEASLPGPGRADATAFTIGNHAYVVSGTNTSVGDLAEVWEFYNGVWTQKSDFAGGPQWGVAAFGFNNKGIVFSGSGENKNVWEYQPNNAVEWPDGSTGISWIVNAPGVYSAKLHNVQSCPVPSSPLTVTTPVLPATVTLTGNDTICEGDSVALTAAGDSWTPKNDFPLANRYATAFALGSAGYFAGGSPGSRSFYQYDPAADSWLQLPDLPMTILSTVAVAWQGKAWLYGSSDKAIWMYNPLRGTWTRKATCPGPARNIVQGFLLGDQIIIVGGIDNTGIPATKEVWAYDLNNDSWTRKNDLPYFVGYAASFAINGKGYLCTGNSSYGVATGTPQSAVFLQYDPASDSWTQLPDFPGGARGGGIAFTDGYKAYVGLGNHAGQDLKDIWQFDPASLSWTRMADIPVGRYGTRAIVLGNYVFLGTGHSVETGILISDIWQYELPYNYQWSTGETTRSILVAQTGDYHVTVSTHAGCTINSNPIHIEVQPATTITKAPADTAVCSDASVHFSVNASGTGISYQWQLNGIDINDGGPYSGTQTNSLTVSDVSIPGPGLFKCVATGACGTDTSAEAALTFLTPPAKPVITPGGSLTLCAGESITLASSSATGNTWSNGTSGAAITVGTQGPYNVYVTGSNGCRSPLSDTVTVIINSLPSKPVIAAGGPVTFCEGGNVTLTSSASSGNIWSTGAGSNDIIATASGSYTVQVKDANGCVSPVSDAVTIAVHPIPAKPSITASGPLEFCEGGSVTLTASPAATYEWSTGSGADAITVDQSGSYTVQINENGCASPVSDAVLVQVHPVPSGVITTNGPLVNGGIRYMELIAPQLPGAQYKWLTGDDEPVIRVTKSGHYRVTVISGAGCYTNFGITVQLIDLTKIPNTFSPNRDGINDYWTIKEINLYANATVTVFNRNGMKVYEAKGSSIKWDGTSNGRQLPAGVYYYVLDLKDGGPPVNGWINLLK